MGSLDDRKTTRPKHPAIQAECTAVSDRRPAMIDLGMIHVDRLIVHEIPRHYVRSEASEGPVLSDVESHLEDDVRNFFQERLVSTLSGAYEVEFDPASGSAIPALVKGLLSRRPPDFVKASQDLANTLHASQAGVNPAGLLTLMGISLGKRSGFAIVKLEKEEGARVERAQVGGRSTFNVSHLRDLMLTRKTKVFKVGLFIPGEGKGDIEALVSDTQKGSGTAVAFFFLSEFLGCKLKEVPEVTTKRFFDVTQRIINDEVESPETKARYQIGLIAELQNSHNAIRPAAFAAAAFDVGDRGRYLEALAAEGLAAGTFAKDIGLIEPILRRIQWNFENGISVLAAPDLVGESLRIAAMADGRTKMEIIDRLKEFKGHR
jgi:hypothetical protein